MVGIAAEKGLTRLVDSKSGNTIVDLVGHLKGVNAVAFSNDGALIATTSDDQTARIWDLHTGKELLILTGHTHDVNSIAFSHDGKRVLTGSSDTTARLWDTNTGAEIAVLRGHTDQVNRVSFSPDGKQAITSSKDKTTIVWDLQWASIYGDDLRERVRAERLIGAQGFAVTELHNPILFEIDKDDPIARNPCLRRGPLSSEYWARLPGRWWSVVSRLANEAMRRPSSMKCSNPPVAMDKIRAIRHDHGNKPER